MTQELDKLLARWVRVGAMYNIASARKTPDIEVLLVDTARLLPGFSRLLPMTVTWLSLYCRLVCRHRLIHMVNELSDQTQVATLGMLLDMVRQINSMDHFNLIIRQCKSLSQPKPLFDIDRQSPKLVDMAQQTTCETGQTWGLWCQPVLLKPDAIRPLPWIMDKNPSYQMRAIFGGNLRASILVMLATDPGVGQSESALARACCATRKAVREALDHLEFCRLVACQVTGNFRRIKLLN
ncbi:MAG: hypothetical protein K9N55_00775 [Phycisphaerae bacterium]|nr:hypothetical protein [Phycisphaerae bacterium]